MLPTHWTQGGVRRGLGGVRERTGRSQGEIWEESGEDWVESGEVWEDSGRDLGEGGPWASPSFEQAVQAVGLPLTVGV